MDALSAGALKFFGGWLAKKIFDETIWDAGKQRLRKGRLASQWESALQAAANKVRGTHPEVATEMFEDGFLEQVIKPIGEQLLESPTRAADTGEIALEFRERFRKLKKDGVQLGQSPILARAEANVEPAISLFFTALNGELANHSELRPAWRDRQLGEIGRNVADMKAQLEQAPRSATNYADKELKRALTHFLARRSFPTARSLDELYDLAQSVLSGELSGASHAQRATALCLFCRLTVNQDLAKAKEYLAAAKELTAEPAPIEDAWIVFGDGRRDEALKLVRDGQGARWQSATFTMLKIESGDTVALDWLNQSNVDLSAWTPQQLINPTFTYAAGDQWDKATAILAALSKEQFAEAPILLALKAAALARQIAVPGSDEFLLGAILPIKPHTLTHRANPQWLEIATSAVRTYDDAASMARALGLEEDANRFEELALWISLEAPALRSNAEQRIRDSFSRRETALQFVPLAKAHDLPVPTLQLRELIAGREGLGGLDATDVRAALVLCDKHEEVLALIGRRKKDVEAVLGLSKTRFLEVEALLSTEGLDAARRRRSDLASDIDAEDGVRLDAMLSESSDAKEAALIELYNKSRNAVDLRNLIGHLAENKKWSAAADRLLELFQLTKLASDAEALCHALANADRYEDLAPFFETNWDQLEHTPELKSFRAMTLARQGRLKEARALIEELFAAGGGVREEQIFSNILIESGDWDALAGLVDRIWQNRATRPPEHLVWAATAAAIVDQPSRAIDLVREATGRPEANAHVFAGAGHIVFAIGRELEMPEASAWIHRAADMSDEEGPIQQVDIRSLIADAPKWRDRQTSALKALYSARTPLFAAGRVLSTTLGDMILGNALRAQSSVDPRSRAAVPTRFGNRPPAPLPVAGTLLLDLSTLYVLESIGILATVLDAGFSLVLPTGTLNALFLERQKARFHQPSQIAQAEKLLALVTQGRLSAAPTATQNHDLEKQIGDSLAHLVMAARANDALVVRPPPISKPGDFSETSVDVSGFQDILTDTRSLFFMLRDKNLLNNAVEARAQAYLFRHDNGWPAPAAPDGKPLMIDNLTLSYLQTAGLLEPLAQSGAKLFIHQEEIDDATALVRHKATLETYFTRLEDLRSRLRDTLLHDKARVAAQVSGDGDHFLHPTVQLMHGANADWIIADDRALNALPQITSEDESKLIPVATSLDLLSALRTKDVINSEDERLYRHRMREAGFFFIPVLPDEFDAELLQAPLDGKALRETRFLQIARQAPLRLATIDAFDMHADPGAFDIAYRSATLVLFRTWHSDLEHKRMRAHADWLLSYLSAQETLAEAKLNGLRGEGLAPMLAPALLPLFAASQEVSNAHREWVEDVFWPAINTRPAVGQAVAAEFRALLRQYLSDDDD